MREYESCSLCPRQCRVNRRMGETGCCHITAELHISSICLHQGEEPPINGPLGICNVFFSKCSLQCVYCQNYQISRIDGNLITQIYGLGEVVGEVISYLDRGIRAVGFVSPTHFSPHVKAIILELHRLGYYPVTVYNTHAYETVDMLRSLEGLIDVYLPDFKYSDPSLASRYSGAADYPEVARKAFAEMYRQKGNALITDDSGQALTGMLIRHLVLPGHATDSINILRWIAEELSPSLHISLMSQYHPIPCLDAYPELDRMITSREYEGVVRTMEELGFRNGWLQHPESCRNYKPDFREKHPFEPGK